ncbi:MAG: hypothetical protein KGL43_03385 [Burkholderiales bacterium]|nr:hypothetical protein [Burkholderiales bacterium]MDE2452615.1 hypothetical protein [Burkholderiales bacterium]
MKPQLLVEARLAAASVVVGPVDAPRVGARQRPRQLLQAGFAPLDLEALAQPAPRAQPLP